MKESDDDYHSNEPLSEKLVLLKETIDGLIDKYGNPGDTAYLMVEVGLFNILNLSLDHKQETAEPVSIMVAANQSLYTLTFNVPIPDSSAFLCLTWENSHPNQMAMIKKYHSGRNNNANSTEPFIINIPDSNIDNLNQLLTLATPKHSNPHP